MPDSISLYIHIPFCIHRCSYCDFNTYAGQENSIEPYVAALNREIGTVAAAAGERLPVHTIFFGGGTPSILPPELIGKLLNTCREGFEVDPQAEVTMEANPGTVSKVGLEKLRTYGLNRISLGMQSAHPAELRLLERQHDTLDVIRAVAWARTAGFDNLNLDLIFGLPAQSLESWTETLKTALGLRPEHLSLYALTIEHGTPFRRWLERGLVQAPDDDLAADMYEAAEELLDREGFIQYEISNWARLRGQQPLVSRHNLQYWLNQPYLGFGAGAHGYAASQRTMNVRGIRAYIQRVNAGGQRPFPAGPGVEQVLPIDTWTAMQEHMMVGLRLVEAGVRNTAFTQRFGFPLESVFPKQIKKLTNQGLLEWVGGVQDQLRLTRRGRLLGNAVFREFIDLPEPDWLAEGYHSTTTRVP